MATAAVAMHRSTYRRLFVMCAYYMIVSTALYCIPITETTEEEKRTHKITFGRKKKLAADSRAQH